ncbi:MAG: helix-turn-helix domain-containing protein [Patescibacteria group bacterium]
MYYPNRIKQYRRRLFLRALELAWVVGRGFGAVGDWENGRTNPSLELALAVAAALEVPVEILFLDQYKQIRKIVRKRMSNLSAKRYPDFRSCPVKWAPQALKKRS